MPASVYEKLHALSRKAALLNSVQGLLDWDIETYMPKEAISPRSEEVELIAQFSHEERTSKRFAKLLFALIDKETGTILDPQLSEERKAALKRWRKDYLQTIKLPSSLIKQYAKATSTASHVWKTARAHNDFGLFAPHLEKIVLLNRKKAEILGFREHPYDALLDLYEPELTISFLTPLFAKLKLFLTELLKEIAACPPVADAFLHHACPKHQQIDFAHKLLHAMGFNPATSRLDLAAHPFCTGLHPLDTRMTTRIHPENVLTNIGAVLHEGGHGLYNMHLPLDQFGSPLGEQASLGIDESQSRFWETIIGQSEPFWQHFFPLLQQEFPHCFSSLSFHDFYRALNRVTPSLIRIDADEVSYNLHIIIRFEIEKALIEGSLRTKDVPVTWNNKMRDYLGVCPDFDGQGCLQDIHWSLGSIGYFPTYTLGNLYAAQFFEAFEKAHPHWSIAVSKGDLGEIRNFLKNNIHCHGRRYLPGELCETVTGKPLSEEPYITYLTRKYKKLYNLK